MVVCDEAHKLSASFFGGEIKETKRYKLGKLLSSLTRHFLLMTATPHNGKEEEFQLSMALLDGDRFEGRFRDGVHVSDTSDLMRRLVKEDLLKFDGKPLFPERIAHTVNYPLSDLEAILYRRVTEYVIGGALVVPIGLLQRLQGKRRSGPDLFATETQRVEVLAMKAVMATERARGYEPRDVSQDKCGYDIESRIPGAGKMRFIEVKGRIEGAEIVTVTKNEIITALNKPDNFILALMRVPKPEEFSEGDAFKVPASRGKYNVGNDSCLDLDMEMRPNRHDLSLYDLRSRLSSPCTTPTPRYAYKIDRFVRQPTSVSTIN